MQNNEKNERNEIYIVGNFGQFEISTFFFFFRKINFEIFIKISKFLFRNILYIFRKNNFEIFISKFLFRNFEISKNRFS
jgi:hypothetical protein